MCINPESWCFNCPDRQRCLDENKKSDGYRSENKMFKLQDLPEWKREVLSKLQR